VTTHGNLQQTFNTPDLVKTYHKGTPLESIKAGHLSLQTPISLHLGSQCRTTWLGRNSLHPSTNTTLYTLLNLPSLFTTIQNPQISHLPTWTMYPSHLCPYSQTSILLPQTLLHLPPLMANIYSLVHISAGPTVKASTGLDSTTCTKIELVASE